MKKKTIEEINENAEKLLLEYMEVISQQIEKNKMKQRKFLSENLSPQFRG